MIRHKLPPGAAVKGNSTPEPQRLGDCLIWLELLDDARRRRRDIVFVTNDHRSHGWVERHRNGPWETHPALVSRWPGLELGSPSSACGSSSTPVRPRPRDPGSGRRPAPGRTATRRSAPFRCSPTGLMRPGDRKLYACSRPFCPVVSCSPVGPPPSVVVLPAITFAVDSFPFMARKSRKKMMKPPARPKT
jgi:hypothetical protein